MTTSIPTPGLEDLADAAFIEAASRLRIIARRVPRGGRHADQRSRDRGAGIEFADYRPYVSGDDMRAIDWNIYQRLHRVFLRVFEEVEDLPLYLLPDRSESMFLESPPRARAALRCAIALAAISLEQHDRIGVFPFADELETLTRPISGRHRLLTLVRSLATVTPGGTTDLGASIRRLNAMNLRRGLLVVISDFFDPGGIEAVIAALRTVRHQLLLVPIVRATDRNPGLDGDVRLVDCETGQSEDVSITPAVRRRYEAAYDRFTSELDTFAARRGAGVLRLDADRTVLPQLASLFEAGRYVT